MKQITEEEWYQPIIERFYCIQLCQLPFSVQEIENMFNLSFFEYTEAGLGLCYRAYIEIEDKMYFLMGFNSKIDKELCILVQVKHYEANLTALLDSICKEFKINKDSLIWITPNPQ